MSRFAGAKNTSAFGGRISFFEEAEGEYIVLMTKAGHKQSKKGKGEYWFANFRVLAAEGEGTAPVGAVRQQMYLYGQNEMHGVALAKSLVMAFEGYADEKDFNALGDQGVAEVMDSYFPPLGQDFAEPELAVAKLRTSPGKSQSGNDITYHNWEPAPEGTLEDLVDVLAQYADLPDGDDE